MAELMHFEHNSEDGREFVFIREYDDRDDVVAEAEGEGYELSSAVELDDPVYSMPTDRRLYAR